MRRVSANKNVLSSRLNSVRQMSCCRSSAGILFHSRCPAAPKLLSPSLDCVRGTVHVWTSADRRCRRPTSWRVGSRRIGTAGRGGGATCTRAPWLKSIHCLTGSQWSCLSTGVMCSRRPAPVTIRAEAFCTDCRRWTKLSEMPSEERVCLFAISAQNILRMSVL